MTNPDLTPTLTLAALADLDGAADPAPFTFGVAGKIVTFPDPLAMSVADSEKFMTDIEQATSLSASLRAWLTEEDYQLLATHLTTRQLSVLIRQVGRHYQAFLGTPGEGHASATA